MLDIVQRNITHMLPHQQMVGISCKPLFESDHKVLPRCKQRFFWQQVWDYQMKNWIWDSSGMSLCNGIILLTTMNRMFGKSQDAKQRDCKKKDWSHVLYIEKSLFNQIWDIWRFKVWRENDILNNPTFMQEKSQYRRKYYWYRMESA